MAVLQHKKSMKEKLLEILKNPNDKLIAVDLDGTLCIGEYWGSHSPEPEPKTEMIVKVREWYNAGAHIVIYTARQPKLYADTHAWLIKHNVPFHGITMTMKPGADLYIDDKALNIEDINL